MSSLALTLLERDWLPDALIRLGIRRLLAERLREERKPDAEAQQAHLMQFVEQLRASPVAIATREANEQHYEVPSAFFERVLGKHLKYSSCYYAPGVTNLDEAEATMLALTCERAQLRDGEEILELGCGWGSLTLWMAAHFPNARITAVSNSRTQKHFIDARAAERGLRNVEVITCDANVLDFPAGAALRPGGLGRDVRAHAQLRDAAAPDCRLDAGRRDAVRAHLHAPRIRLSV